MVVQLRRRAFLNKIYSPGGVDFCPLSLKVVWRPPFFISFLGFTYIELQVYKLLLKSECRFYLGGMTLTRFALFWPLKFRHDFLHDLALIIIFFVLLLLSTFPISNGTAFSILSRIGSLLLNSKFAKIFGKASFFNLIEPLPKLTLFEKWLNLLLKLVDGCHYRNTHISRIFMSINTFSGFFWSLSWRTESQWRKTTGRC